MLRLVYLRTSNDWLTRMTRRGYERLLQLRKGGGDQAIRRTIPKRMDKEEIMALRIAWHSLPLALMALVRRFVFRNLMWSEVLS